MWIDIIWYIKYLKFDYRGCKQINYELFLRKNKERLLKLKTKHRSTSIWQSTCREVLWQRHYAT